MKSGRKQMCRILQPIVITHYHKQFTSLMFIHSPPKTPLVMFFPLFQRIAKRYCIYSYLILFFIYINYSTRIKVGKGFKRVLRKKTLLLFSLLFQHLIMSLNIYRKAEAQNGAKYCLTFISNMKRKHTEIQPQILVEVSDPKIHRRCCPLWLQRMFRSPAIQETIISILQQLKQQHIHVISVKFKRSYPTECTFCFFYITWMQTYLHYI